MKRKPTMTPKQKKHRFSVLADMGCIICGTPPQIHHCRGHEFGTGMGLKAKDEFTIPLCHLHHLGNQGFHYLGKRAWETKFGTQKYWLTVTNDKLKSREAMK